ncbi:MAG: T9SS type A sorting domain-containing protein, partial [Segetibacter sp.]
RIADLTIKKAVIRIFDLNGRVVMVKQAAFSNVPINVSRFSNGTYLVSVYDDNGKLRNQVKFIKN